MLRMIGIGLLPPRNNTGLDDSVHQRRRQTDAQVSALEDGKLHAPVELPSMRSDVRSNRASIAEASALDLSGVNACSLEVPAYRLSTGLGELLIEALATA